MKIDLNVIWKELRWPVGLTAVLSAVLLLFGVDLDQLLVIASSMVGMWALASLFVNIFKVTGVVDPGTAGKWSAIINLGALSILAYLSATNPAFNFAGLDAQLSTIAQFGALIFAGVINVIGSRAAHKVQVEGLGIRAFTFAY